MMHPFIPISHRYSMTDLHTLKKNLQSRISKFSDRKTKAWWEQYVKHHTTFRGVGIPKIRNELKAWYKEEHIGTLPLHRQLHLALSFFADTYAEDKLAGILFLQLYLYRKCDYKTLLSKFELIFDRGYIYDWNVCDWFCVKVLGPLIQENGMPCARAVARWSHADNVWQARCAVVAFARLTEERAFTPLLLESCAVLIKREERFAKTGVGWILRELSKTNKRVVVDFINAHAKYFSTESMRNATKYFTTGEKAQPKKERQ